MKPSKKEGYQFHWPSLSDQREEEIRFALQLFARTLRIEMAPLLESIQSDAELLQEVATEELLRSGWESGFPRAKITPYRILGYIAQKAAIARRLLDNKVQIFLPTELTCKYDKE